MVIKFKSIKLHNFCSYRDSEIDLINKGFCLVSGRNTCKKDSALSNGSGKSTIWSAICYTLTGETISGIKSNLKNINIEEPDSYSELKMTVDTDEYIITRYCSPKSDLKIIKNGTSIGGKTYRESEKILCETLPDLNKNLISSTIILGQNMPNRFSSFNPSGRKELLETLTKSDFMIEDIKNRIVNRLQTLNTQLRTYEDSILVNNTQIISIEAQLKQLEADVQKYKTVDVDSKLDVLKESIDKNDIRVREIKIECDNLEQEIDRLNTDILEKTNEKAAVADDEFKKYTEAYNKNINEKNVKQNSLNFIKAEIKKLKNVTDVCPTCHQKIPGILKPSTCEQEEKVKILESEIDSINNALANIGEQHKNYVASIESNFSIIATNRQILLEKKADLLNLKSDFTNLSNKLATDTAELSKLQYEKENSTRILDSLNKKINETCSLKNTILNNINIAQLGKSDIDAHICTLKKIESLVKRDFRGFLLYNIIEYLNKKVQEYSQVVFNNTELKIYLDGNSLDISYCGKLYESLSGGEKQRVDVIIQFAIRDLLQEYFNYSSNILVLDEITDNLDKIATTKIFDLITDKLQDVESIFIISHHDEELAIPVDTEIQVIKDENSISSIKEK